MGPVGHILISTALGGGIWLATDSPAAGLVAVGVGVLMDVDHLYDCYQRNVRWNLNKTYLPLHAWEYSLAGLVALIVGLHHPLLVAIVLSHLAHVTTNHFVNGFHPLGYSLTYRVAKRFDAASISPNHDPVTGYQGWLHHIPFGYVLEPWFEKRVDILLSAQRKSGD